MTIRTMPFVSYRIWEINLPIWNTPFFLLPTIKPYVLNICVFLVSEYIATCWSFSCRISMWYLVLFCFLFGHIAFQLLPFGLFYHEITSLNVLTQNFPSNSQKNSNFADDCLLLFDLSQNLFSHLKIVYLIIPCKHIHFWEMLKYFQIFWLNINLIFVLIYTREILYLISSM